MKTNQKSRDEQCQCVLDKNECIIFFLFKNSLFRGIQHGEKCYYCGKKGYHKNELIMKIYKNIENQLREDKLKEEGGDK